jgi:carbon monoxide dehydrogenase subunit G
MSEVHVKIEIDIRPERVWETIMDPDRLGDWVTIHRSVKNVSDRPLARGATMDQMMVMRGVTFRVHWTLVEFDPPNHAEWEGRGPAHSHARIRYDLSGGDGRTSFDYTNAFTPPGGRLGQVASRVIVGAASEREAKKSLARLKALLER